jgi:hypothetical protein
MDSQLGRTTQKPNSKEIKQRLDKNNKPKNA